MSVGGQQSLRLASWAREVREFYPDAKARAANAACVEALAEIAELGGMTPPAPDPSGATDG